MYERDILVRGCDKAVPAAPGWVFGALLSAAPSLAPTAEADEGPIPRRLSGARMGAAFFAKRTGVLPQGVLKSQPLVSPVSTPSQKTMSSGGAPSVPATGADQVLGPQLASLARTS